VDVCIDVAQFRASIRSSQLDNRKFSAIKLLSFDSVYDGNSQITLPAPLDFPSVRDLKVDEFISNDIMNSILEKLRSLRDTATPEEKFIRKGTGAAFTISYETEITEKSPGPKIPPYYNYDVWLKLSYTDGGRERNYKTVIANGTMTQLVELTVSGTARNAIRQRILTMLALFKYGAFYQSDEKMKKLLQADAHFITVSSIDLPKTDNVDIA